tara:strand:- start:554 stop:1201 length:648 start_codon:yes stop_codon:yes gene_type:complete
VNQWVNKDTEIYCSFAETSGNTGCQMMNSAFYYYGLNKIYKSFSVSNIEDAVKSVRTLNIKGFAITMPYKVEVLKYVDECEVNVNEVGCANTVINDNNRLKAYNTDVYSATTVLNRYNNQKTLYIVGDGGYSKSVEWVGKINRFETEYINRENWNEIYDIRDSVVYNCTPVDITNMIHKSNDFINCLVETEIGKELATLQASRQFKLYTGLEFPF